MERTVFQSRRAKTSLQKQEATQGFGLGLVSHTQINPTP